ncbi:MAG: NeuD/PglB/VioB family sugar acetyltransferase [Muribaculum sp.]|nr:NeuD/PglB/VioB family sugar acetyltransferase [Muribaculum sp.]
MQVYGLKRIAIIGAGEFGRQAAHHILQNNRNSLQYEIVGWYDDTYEKGEIVCDYPVLGVIASVMDDFKANKFEHLFIAIGYNHPQFKDFLIQQFKNHIPLYNIISSDAHIDPTSVIGDNIFIYPGAIIDKDVKLEDGVTINLGSIVSHNSIVGACSFIAPGVTIAGFSQIGRQSFIGAGAIVKDNMTICDNVTLGAGCVAVKDILNPGTYIGVPAKILNK